jgi:hypothetical protein
MIDWLQYQSVGSAGAATNRHALGQLGHVPEEPAASATGKSHLQA